MQSPYFRKCSLAFYLLGQNSYNLRANRFSVWLQHVPRIFSLLQTIAAICWHLVSEKNLQRPITLINAIKLIVALSIDVLVVLEYFMMPNGVRKLNHVYRDTIDYLEQKLYVNIDYDLFKGTFQRKLQLVLVVFLLIFALKAIFVSYVDIEIGEIAQFFIYYLKLFALMHILFHIEFAHFLMQTINMEFNALNIQNESMIKPMQPRTIALLHVLRHCKHIHFRVWDIFRILNIRFGWILMALLLATLLDITYSSYWMWVYIHIHKSHQEYITFHRIMRKTLWH